MKFQIVSSSSLLISTILASPTPPQGPRRFNQLASLVFHHIKDQTSDTFDEVSNKIKSYGCHCFPENARGPQVSGGVPVDSIDQACKQLAICRSCINMHEKDMEWPMTDTVFDRYRYRVANNGNILCSKQTGDNKSLEALCECDDQFAVQLKAVYNNWNQKYWYHNKNKSKTHLEKDQMCHPMPEIDPKTKQLCCGNFPNPMNYFNPDKQVCCNGDITSIGSC